MLFRWNIRCSGGDASGLSVHALIAVEFRCLWDSGVFVRRSGLCTWGSGASASELSVLHGM